MFYHCEKFAQLFPIKFTNKKQV